MSVPPSSPSLAEIYQAGRVSFTPPPPPKGSRDVLVVVVDGRSILLDPGLPRDLGATSDYVVHLRCDASATEGVDVPLYRASSRQEAMRIAAVTAQALRREVLVLDPAGNIDGYAWCSYLWFGKVRHAVARYSGVANTRYSQAAPSETTAGLVLGPNTDAMILRHGQWVLHQKASRALEDQQREVEGPQGEEVGVATEVEEDDVERKRSGPPPTTRRGRAAGGREVRAWVSEEEYARWEAEAAARGLRIGDLVREKTPAPRTSAPNLTR